MVDQGDWNECDLHRNYFKHSSIFPIVFEGVRGGYTYPPIKKYQNMVQKNNWYLEEWEQLRIPKTSQPKNNRPNILSLSTKHATTRCNKTLQRVISWVLSCNYQMTPSSLCSQGTFPGYNILQQLDVTHTQKREKWQKYRYSRYDWYMICCFK